MSVSQLQSPLGPTALTRTTLQWSSSSAEEELGEDAAEFQRARSQLFSLIGCPCKFGACSIFDVILKEGEDFPFQFPVQSYLEEVTVGMYGAMGPGGDKNAKSEDKRRWQRLKSLLSQATTQECCQTLAWLSISVLFHRVQASQQILAQLRTDFSEQWRKMTEEVQKQDKKSPAMKDWLLSSIPVVLVQVVYRLLVDGFNERALLVQHAVQVIHKLMVLTLFEVTGFKVGADTAQLLRNRLFRPPVMEQPHVNQRDAVLSELRRERLEQDQQQCKPLSFLVPVAEKTPMDESQLDHLLELRAQEAEEGQVPARSFKHQYPELSVDRYNSLTNHAEELMVDYLQVLYGLGAGRDRPQSEASSQSDGTSETGSKPCSPFGAPPSPTTSAAVLKRTSMAKRRTLRTGRMMEKDKELERERQKADALERRRREEKIVQVISAPLPQVYLSEVLDTNVVSPWLQRLTPADSEGGWLHKRASEGHRLIMAEPKLSLLPHIKGTAKSTGRAPDVISETSHSKRMPRDASPHSTQAGATATTGRKAGLPVQFVTRLQCQAASGGSPGASSPSKKALVPKPSGLPSLAVTLEPPGPVSREEVKQRLEQELQAFKQNSFEQYKLDYDVCTGLKKHRMDHAGLEREEKEFVNKLETLVGSASAPAFRLLGPGRPLATAAAAALLGKTSTASRSVSSLGARSAAERRLKKPWNELTSLEH